MGGKRKRSAPPTATWAVGALHTSETLNPKCPFIVMVSPGNRMLFNALSLPWLHRAVGFFQCAVIVSGVLSMSFHCHGFTGQSDSFNVRHCHGFTGQWDSFNARHCH